MGASFRDQVYQLSPRWLRGFFGGRVMYTFGLSLDMLADKMEQGQKLHIPTYGDPSALPYLGADRLITRGIVEDSVSYAGRLKLSWDDWGFAGAPRADLRETNSYWLPLKPECLTVSDEGLWNDYLAGDDTTQPPAHYRVQPSNWDWDSLNLGGGAHWWRCFLIFYSISPNDFTHPEDVWGIGLWGDPNGSWGLDVPPGVFTGLRAILAQWQGEHAWFEWIIISFDASLYRPSGAIGVENPDGRWGRWSKIVPNGATGIKEYVASRNANSRYANGPG